MDNSIKFGFMYIIKMIGLIAMIPLLIKCNASAGKSAELINRSNDSVENMKMKSDTNYLDFNSGVRAILHDSKGNYWFGSHSSGACKFDGETYTYYTTEDGLSNNQVRRIIEDKDGTIWFGTGMGVTSYRDGEFTQHTSELTFPLMKARGMQWHGAPEDLWFNAGNRFGVYRYDGEQMYFHEFPQVLKLREEHLAAVTGIVRGKDDKVWIATYTGVYSYDGKDLDFISEYDVELGSEEYIHVRSIYEDSKGDLWIGNNGIGVLKKEGDHIYNFSKKHGLLGEDPKAKNLNLFDRTLEHVFAIGEDADGNMWFGDRDTGAWRFDGKKMVNYRIEKNQGSQHLWQFYTDRNGTFLIAAENGVYTFDGKALVRKF